MGAFLMNGTNRTFRWSVWQVDHFVNSLSFFAIVITVMILSGLPRLVEAASIIRAPNNLGLVGYWSFDEGQGTQVSDLSGSGNHGSLVNGPTWSRGKVGGALDFDGSTSYVNVPHSSSLNITSSITISVWFKLNNSPTYVDLVNKVRNDAQYYLGLSDSIGNQPYFLGGGQTTDSPDTIEHGKWYHLVGVFDDVANTNSIYINGVLSVSEANYTSTVANSNPVTIGSWKSGTESFVDGLIDEVRIYNRALSATEVTTLYNNSKGVILGNTSSQYTDGLVAHYTFDGSTISGVTLKDVVGGNNGTINETESVMGKIGQGMKFKGNPNSYIEIPHSFDFDVSELTLAMWIKTPVTMNCSPSCYRALLSKQGTTGVGSRNYNLYSHTNDGQSVTGLHFSSASFGGSDVFSLPSPFEPNSWHHVAVTINSTGRVVYYADGVQFATRQGVAGTADDGYPIRIGRADNFWNGSLDDVRVYNRALSPEEVRGLADGGFGVMASKAPFQKGSILMERWEGVGGTSISNIPLHLSPTRTEERTSFEAPVSWGDNYGLRMSGFLYPETTGNYTFWIASDDNGQLWLSTNSTRANKQLIAQVNTYTSSRQWNKESNQKSAEIRLVAGQRYYIEALMKEGGGGDSLAVSWKLNDTTDPPNGSTAYIIPGSFLSPWVD